MMGRRSIRRIDEQPTEREERLEEALRRIADWADAYPPAVFPMPTEDDCKRAHEALKAIGMTLDRFSADAMRHVVTRVGKIAKDALA